jgi:hypothetical protein
MNTPTISNVIARMLVALMFSFSFFATAAQAVTVENSFDHSKTGFVLREVHATLKCEQCHVDGIFKNTPKDCAGCHNTGTRVAALPKPINHIPTTFSCDTCHISAASFLIKSFSHVTITGQCATCHNGQSLGVVSKPANHFPTQQPCEYCHKNTSTFLSYQVDHVANGYVGNCFQCHGGPAGEPGPIGTYPNVVSYNAATHFPLTSFGTTPPDCNACHTGYSTFLGATFAHAPGSTCTSCHQGQYAGVVSINRSIHIPLPTGSTCASCHPDPTTQVLPTFLGVAFHTTSIGNPPAGTCATCHNGSFVSQNAQTKGVTHIPTTADCGTCHTGPSGTPANTSLNYTTFLQAKFHQTTLGNPPTVTCTTCHNGGYLSEGAQTKSVGHVVTTSDCVACHTAANTVTYTTFLGASFSHSPGAYASFPSVAPASPTCSSCHNGSTATGKVTSHVPTTGDCISCHTNATTGCPNCVTFYGVIYSHINATVGVAPYGVTFPALGSTPTPTCGSCHNGTTALGKNTGHVTTTLDCITCHGCPSGNCTTFLGATYSHAGIAAGSCGTCHQGQYAGVVSINPAIHIPQSSGNACDVCHTNTITGLPSSATPTFLNVTFHQTTLGKPPTGLCSTCHNGSYVSTQAKPADSKTSLISNHVATTADCVTCHTATNTANYTSFLGAGFTHSPGTYAAWPPSPVTPTCSSCHNGATATGKNAGHPVTALDCMSCHTTTVLQGCPTCTLFGIPAGVIHNAAPYNTPGTCVTCHNGTTAIGLSSDTGHIPIGSAGCDQCHPVYDGVGSINFSTAAVSTISVSGVTKYGMKHSAMTGRCDSCHNGSYTGQGLFGAVTKVSNHIPTTIISTSANTDCTSCHSTTINITSGAADWATGERMNHNNAMGGAPNYCVTCHLKGVTYLSRAQLISHNGASTSKDCSSSSCHKPLGSKGSAYSSWD